MTVLEVFSLMSLIRVMANEEVPGGNMKPVRVKIIFIIYCLSHFVFQIHLKMLVPYGHPDFVKYGQKETPF